MILLDIVHDVSVTHPLGNCDELPFLHISINALEPHDVRVGQSAPEYDFPAKLLEQSCLAHVLAIQINQH